MDEKIKHNRGRFKMSEIMCFLYGGFLGLLDFFFDLNVYLLCYFFICTVVFCYCIYYYQSKEELKNE